MSKMKKPAVKDIKVGDTFVIDANELSYLSVHKDGTVDCINYRRITGVFRTEIIQGPRPCRITTGGLGGVMIQYIVNGNRAEVFSTWWSDYKAAIDMKKTLNKEKVDNYLEKL